MLLSLSIKNFTLVEQLHIELRPGMTAITGETGAGKSLILDALGMALGDRGDPARIRAGSDKLDVTAIFAVDHNPGAHTWLKEHDLLEDGECILRRTLSAEGRSRGFINGQPAPMQQLKELGEMMIDIHSQHEHQSLLVRDTHRRLVDAFGGCGELCARTGGLYREWREVQERLRNLEDNAEEQRARRDLLRFQLEELEELDLSPGETAALEEEQNRLANAEQILRDSHQVLTLCREGYDVDILALLGRASHLLDAMPDRSPRLEEASAMLANARIQVEEASRELQHHMDSFDLSPERLAEVESRLSLIYQLSRKHRLDPEELPDLRNRIEAELAALTEGEEDQSHLESRLTALEQALSEAEQALSSKRAEAAVAFAGQVNAQLKSLAMGSAHLEVKLNPEQRHTDHGRESIEFLVSTNPGQPALALSKVASGGELSRISLAIQVVAARHTDIPTLVFDEVDVGVGGAVAEVVGRLLRQLGERGQVVCVTHLPQVASCAHHHVIASKSSKGDSTESALAEVRAEQRVNEIARMLGGARITRQTLAHAEEMLDLSARGE